MPGRPVAEILAELPPLSPEAEAMLAECWELARQNATAMVLLGEGSFSERLGYLARLEVHSALPLG
jgi:hypothetical protein